MVIYLCFSKRKKKSPRERVKTESVSFGHMIGAICYRAPMVFSGHHRECCSRWCLSKPLMGSFVPFVGLFAALYGLFRCPLVG